LQDLILAAVVTLAVSTQAECCQYCRRLSSLLFAWAISTIRPTWIHANS